MCICVSTEIWEPRGKVTFCSCLSGTYRWVNSHKCKGGHSLIISYILSMTMYIWKFRNKFLNLKIGKCYIGVQQGYSHDLNNFYLYYTFIHLFWVLVFKRVRCMTCTAACIWRSEGNLGESAFLFYHEGPGEQTQVAKLCAISLYLPQTIFISIKLFISLRGQDLKSII